MCVHQQGLDSTGLDVDYGVSLSPALTHQLFFQLSHLLHHFHQVQNLHQKELLLEVRKSFKFSRGRRRYTATLKFSNFLNLKITFEFWKPIHVKFSAEIKTKTRALIGQFVIYAGKEIKTKIQRISFHYLGPLLSSMYLKSIVASHWELLVNPSMKTSGPIVEFILAVLLLQSKIVLKCVR